jgi:hypothetical protein
MVASGAADEMASVSRRREVALRVFAARSLSGKKPVASSSSGKQGRAAADAGKRSGGGTGGGEADDGDAEFAAALAAIELAERGENDPVGQAPSAAGGAQAAAARVSRTVAEMYRDVMGITNMDDPSLFFGSGGGSGWGGFDSEAAAVAATLGDTEHFPALAKSPHGLGATTSPSSSSTTASVPPPPPLSLGTTASTTGVGSSPSSFAGTTQRGWSFATIADRGYFPALAAANPSPAETGGGRRVVGSAAAGSGGGGGGGTRLAPAQPPAPRQQPKATQKAIGGRTSSASGGGSTSSWGGGVGVGGVGEEETSPAPVAHIDFASLLAAQATGGNGKGRGNGKNGGKR